MKKAVILIVFVALFAVGAYFGLKHYEKQTVILACETRQTETGIFLEALKSEDKARCVSLRSPLHERCIAYIADDSNLCLPDDLDCKAIASHDMNRCAEPLCRAMASGNESECDLLADSVEWCKRMVRLEPSPVDSNTCLELAELPN